MVDVETRLQFEQRRRAIGPPNCPSPPLRASEAVPSQIVNQPSVAPAIPDAPDYHPATSLRRELRTGRSSARTKSAYRLMSRKSAILARGVVADIMVRDGDHVNKGQPRFTRERMSINCLPVRTA